MAIKKKGRKARVKATKYGLKRKAEAMDIMQLPEDEKEADALLNSLGSISVMRGRAVWAPGKKVKPAVAKILKESVEALNEFVARGELKITKEGKIRVKKEK